MPIANMNLGKLVEDFRCEDSCRELLEELRWPDKPVCPECEGTSTSRIHDRNLFECNAELCRYQFSVTVKTVMENTKLPLWKWFLATYLMCESKKGISANQLKRMLNVSYKTAWHLCHRIRAAMGSLIEDKLSGVVEVDETSLGQRRKGGMRVRKGRPARFPNKPGPSDRQMVVGAVERDGGVRLKVSKGASREILHRFAAENISQDATVHTDGHPSYVGIPGHDPIDKRNEGYVTGTTHTQTIESVWSLFKRSIVGAYHNLSVKHLPAYLDEMEWRFNNRDNAYMFRDTLLAMLGCGPVPYNELVNQNH